MFFLLLTVCRLQLIFPTIHLILFLPPMVIILTNPNTFLFTQRYFTLCHSVSLPQVFTHALNSFSARIGYFIMLAYLLSSPISPHTSSLAGCYVCRQRAWFWFWTSWYRSKIASPLFAQSTVVLLLRYRRKYGDISV